MVVPDQIIDRTRAGRPTTFFGDGLVVHVGFADPFCGDLSARLVDSAGRVGQTVHAGGAYVAMEGPLFSTRAESHLYRSWDAAIIGMTAIPEAKLAREAEIAYAMLATATDYDVWHESEADVTAAAVAEIVAQNVQSAQRIVADVALNLPPDWTSTADGALFGAIMTDPRRIPAGTLERYSLADRRPPAVTAGSAVELAVVGAIALDEIHSQAGDVDQLLGGSAVYASLAASLLAQAAPISVIGDDFDLALLQPLIERGVRLDGVVNAKGPNFRWSCRYSPDGDFRETLYTRAGVYDTHPIIVAEAIRYARFVLLTAGNPEQNRRAIEQMISPELVAIDTIEREVAERREEFRDQLQHADLVSINTLEAAHLIQWSGDQDDPALPLAAWREINALGPSIFILKKASHGVEIFERQRRVSIGAVPNVQATDPTGAGDTFISAVLSALARGQDLIQAAVWGCATASFAIEAFGIDGILRATPEAIRQRIPQITIEHLDPSTPLPQSR